MNSKTALVLLGLIAFVYSQTLVVSSTAFFSDVVCGSSGTNPCSGWVCGGANQSTCASYGATYGDSSLPQYQSRWGTPVGQVKSGLGYSPISSVSTQIDSDFYVGTLTHFNFPINSGTAAASVQLNLIVSFKTTGGADVATQSFSFTLSIDETPNGTPCTYSSSTPCSDKISYPAGGFDRSSSFTYNDVSYTLQLKGFKESTSSLSSPIVDFISNENGSRLGYLFARITAACPTSCVGGGSVIITPDSRCVCDCSSATACVSPQVFAPDCSCVCPSSTCRNGTVVKTPTGCTCDCSSVPCASPRQQAADCSCACPTNYCNGYPISNPTTCACSCPTAAELGCGANFVVDSRCQCSCPLTDASCGANKVENPNPNICGCICDSTTCQTNFQKDPVTCGCVCSLSCPNGEVLPNCTCGNCVGNFQLNVTTGQCTGCSLSADNCTGGNSFDASACRCVCDQLVCNLYNNSEVVDSTKDCACRPCVAGECICGNGKIEVGEDCDLGPNVTNPCCVNCKFTTDACTDPNLCNANGVCDGAGQCSGRYKCPPNSVCTSYTCDPNVGDCVANVQPNGTACFQFTGQPLDLCVRSCQGGTCVDYTAENGLFPDCSDDDPADCQVPRCDSATGTCVFDILPDNTPCSDGLSCTLGDICLSGNCTGTPRDCTLEPLSANLTVCNKVICEEFGLYYSCSVVPDRVGQSCDDGNACTLNDVCSPQGECIPSRKTVRCPRAEPCKTFTCDRLTGQCIPTLYGNETVCNDKNNCTVNDRCDNGTCVGYPDDNTALLAECGFVPPTPSNPAGTNSIIVLAAVLGAALVAGIAAVALIVKKIQKARLLDPDTWNPDAFSSVGANPFYQASQKMVDSPLYEGN